MQDSFPLPKQELIKYLDGQDFLNLGQSNKNLRDLCQDDEIWKAILKREFGDVERFKPSCVSWKEYYLLFLHNNPSYLHVFSPDLYAKIPDKYILCWLTGGSYYLGDLFPHKQWLAFEEVSYSGLYDDLIFIDTKAKHKPCIIKVNGEGLASHRADVVIAIPSIHDENGNEYCDSYKPSHDDNGNSPLRIRNRLQGTIKASFNISPKCISAFNALPYRELAIFIDLVNRYSLAK